MPDPAPAATATVVPPEPPADPEPKPGDDTPLGEAGEKALEAWKDRAKKAESKAKELEPLAAKAREAEEANKTELEKANGKVEGLTGENADLKAQVLRLQVALDNNVPADLVDRLRGSSEEELKKDAEELMKRLGGPSGTATDFGGGPREPAPAGDMDSAIRRRASA